MTTDPTDSADITVTTATRTEDEVRAAFDAPPAPPVPEPVVGKIPALDAASASALEAEIDQAEPPVANETPEQQVARRSRATSKVLKEIALRKTAETEREALRRENADLRRAAATPPPAGDKKTGVPAASAAAVPAAPVFTFDSFGDYEAKHDGATYEDYIDARTDARAEFIDGQKQATAARAAADKETRDRFAVLETSAATFKEDHADYDAVVGRVVLDDVPEGLQADLQRLLLKAGDQTPAILYHLGTHPEDAERLLASPTRGDLTETFGELKAAVKRAAAEAAAQPGEAPPKPTKPVTGAPAPLNPVPGASAQSRTLAQVAEVDDDADAYIERRKREQAGT